MHRKVSSPIATPQVNILLDGTSGHWRHPRYIIRGYLKQTPRLVNHHVFLRIHDFIARFFMISVRVILFCWS